MTIDVVQTAAFASLILPLSFPEILILCVFFRLGGGTERMRKKGVKRVPPHYFDYSMYYFVHLHIATMRFSVKLLPMQWLQPNEIGTVQAKNEHMSHAFAILLYLDA